MFSRAVSLYEDNDHQCLMFTDLVQGSGIQANQFLIIDQQQAALLDPGGDLTFAPLSVQISRHTSLDKLEYILASHQDPDIIASLPKWIMKTPARVVTSRLWARFLPHLVPAYMKEIDGLQVDNRIIPLEDRGGVIPLGACEIHALPAHFLHSVGNFQFFDVKSRILFSGDMGASLVDDSSAAAVVDSFEDHIPKMRGFHQRYMTSNKVCRLWAAMVKQLNVSMIVPQHGRAFRGRQIAQFLQWIETLECGIDLMNERDYQPLAGSY